MVPIVSRVSVELLVPSITRLADSFLASMALEDVVVIDTVFTPVRRISIC